MGYIENFTFPSGSDVVRVVVQEEAGGTLRGWVSFGQGSPPALDPEHGFPRDDTFETFIQEGFAFSVSQPLVTGKRLVFQLARNEQWSQWCALHNPILSEPGHYYCINIGTGGTKSTGMTHCEVAYSDHTWHEVDCLIPRSLTS